MDSNNKIRWNIAGPNTCPTSQTGSEQANRIAPCASTARTIHRHHDRCTTREGSVFGIVSCRIANTIIATMPWAQCPTICSTRIARAMSRKLNSGWTRKCQRSGNGASGGRIPAATATSSHKSGGSQA